VNGDLPAPSGARATRPAPPRRWVMVALGWLFFAIGLVGMALPLLPTTPFMLLALWAFSLGSERFHAWLYHHRVFGPPLRRWSEERIIPLWTKALAVGSMAASLAWTWLALDVPWYALAAMGLVIVAGVAFILRFPSRRPLPRRGEAP
jgi:uncharacterized membrane protein YbaN (DUF454 family)